MTTDTTNLINSGARMTTMDTAVTFEKMGTIRTNTLKSVANASQTKPANSNIIYPNKIPGATSNHQIRSSSSSSSSTTTASPTTALLSCSVNNHSNHNFGAGGSQSSNSNSANTNNTNVLLTNGLLTTASPLKLPNGGEMTGPAGVAESLYTSIEATQKLLQQQQQQQQQLLQSRYIKILCRFVRLIPFS